MLKNDTSTSVWFSNSRLPWTNHAFSSAGAVYTPVTVSYSEPKLCEITACALPARVLYCDFVPQSLQLSVTFTRPAPARARALIVTRYEPPGAAAGVVPTPNIRYGGPPCPSWQYRSHSCLGGNAIVCGPCTVMPGVVGVTLPVRSSSNASRFSFTWMPFVFM